MPAELPRTAYILGGWFRSLSGFGILLGTIFLSASLTPTLIPRSYFFQGALAGVCFALGYGFGVFWRWLWRFLELREPPQALRYNINRFILVACIVIIAVFLGRTTEWQNSIRAAMNMAPVETAHPIKLFIVALLVFGVLLLFARLFSLVTRFLKQRINSFLPRRASYVLALLIASLLFWSVANTLLLRTTFRLLDSSYRQYDALLEPDRAQPTEAGKTGSALSLLRWNELGRAGREYVASNPTARLIESFTQRPAREPIRVYVGLRSAETPEARAKLALEELKRQGGFERSMLILITPTGTGWVDPSAITPVEYLHGGDVASVAVQYSYLSSPLSLLVQPEYGEDSAKAVFAAIYGYWTTLPREKRPKLYLHGLSLGALNSEKSVELFEMIGDPISGALWSGPPFESRIWRYVTSNRNPGSAPWLPTYRDNRFVRFLNQDGPVIPGPAPWGPMRVVYLQYASDAVTFFSYRSAFQPPAWMEKPPGPDISPALRWYPVVTMLQLAVDMAVATTTPLGYGHAYAPEHYVDAWIALTDPQGWSPEAIAKLKTYLAQQARQPAAPSQMQEAPYFNRGG